jgi:hypothetical protein
MLEHYLCSITEKWPYPNGITDPSINIYSCALLNNSTIMCGF